MWQILGSGASKLLRSGDPVQDDDSAAGVRRQGYDRSVKFERQPDGRTATARSAPTTSRFLTPSSRRTGAGASTRSRATPKCSTGASAATSCRRSHVCLAYVDAQREYATRRPRRQRSPRVRAEAHQLARQCRTGCTGRPKEGEPPSPMGPLAARAHGQGYGTSRCPLPRLSVQDSDRARARTRRAAHTTTSSTAG